MHTWHGSSARCTLQTDICHVSGADNAVADALSRSPVNAISLPSGVDFTTLITAQRNDSELVESPSEDYNQRLKAAMLD